MAMILGCPFIQQVDLTNQLIESLSKTVKDKDNFTLALIDNGSPENKISFKEIDTRDIKTYQFSPGENQGYYYPLNNLYPFQDELIGLVHNDIIFYEEGWDIRLQEAFKQDPQLGLVGLCGSWDADWLGGRGGGTMCYFRGEKGQDQSAGQRITELRAAVLLDSLFMVFRKEVIPHLKIDENIAPCHFYDKIWCCRTLEAGYRVAVLGSEIDHLGGQTAVGVLQYHEDALKWCVKQGLDYTHHELANGEKVEGENPGLAVYLEAERRFLNEYREEKKLIPCRVDPNYSLRKLSP